MKIQWKQTACALLAAMIWGSAFVAQSEGARSLPPMSFNACRFAVGALVLALFLQARRGVRAWRHISSPPLSRSFLLRGGVICGAILGVATNLQQMGIAESGAGKAAFITSLYIVLVPILGLFLHKKVSPLVCGAVLLAAVGLFFLCIKPGEDFSVGAGDGALMLCALLFSFHILCVDHYSARVDPVALTCLQFVTAGILSAVGALFAERPSWEQILACAVPILYVGVISCGLGYTLQAVAQRGGDPTVVALLLSLESLFGLVTERIVQPDVVHLPREYFGCVLMLCAVCAAQIPFPLRKRKKEASRS